MGNSPATKGSDWERILIFSDTHSVFIDKKKWGIFLQIVDDYSPDRAIGNGDILDCVGISSHAKKLASYTPEVLEDYPFDYELDLTFQEILKPLREAMGKTAKLQLRLGNHEWRFIRPDRANASALAQMHDVCAKRGKTRLEDLMQLDHPKVKATLSYNGIDMLYGTFAIIHGDKLSPTAARQNLMKYGSGTSGHSHRANSFTQLLNGNIQGWWESGCMMRTDNVPYLPHGVRPDWLNAFLSLTINRRTGTFFCKTHAIIGNTCEFNGRIYKG